MATLLEVGFSEGAGTTAADSSGLGHHLTIPASAWTPDGHTGPGLAQTAAGGAARADLGGGTATAWTRMAWVYRTAATTDMVICEIDQLVLYVTPTGQVGIWSSRLNSGYTTSGVHVPLHTWVHLSITATGSSPIYLQVNAVGVDSGAAGHGALSLAAPVYVGIDSDATGHSQGRIDDLRIFDTILDDPDVATWMATPVGGSSGNADRSITDTITITDTSGPQTQTVTTTTSETTSVTDITTVVTQAGRTLADTTALADLTTTTTTTSRTAIDPLPITDTTTLTTTAARTPGDPLPIIDQMTAILTTGGTDTPRNPADTLPVTDTATSQHDASRSTADHTQITDHVLATLDHVRTVANLIGIIDTTTTAPTPEGTLRQAPAAQRTHTAPTATRLRTPAPPTRTRTPRRQP